MNNPISQHPPPDTTQELLPGLQQATDPMESALITTLLSVIKALAKQDAKAAVHIDPLTALKAMLSLSTPTVGAAYKKFIADLYFTQLIADQQEPDTHAPPAQPGAPEPINSKISTCLSKALEHAHKLHQVVNKPYTKDLVEATTYLAQRAMQQPWATTPKLVYAIEIADTTYLVSSHPDQTPENRQASQHAGQARTCLILAQAILQGFNRTMGNTTTTAAGHPVAAALHGKYLYQHFIREQVQELENHYVVIDVKTGAFEASPTEAQAHAKLRMKNPEALCWVQNTGPNTTPRASSQTDRSQPTPPDDSPGAVRNPPD